MRWFLIFTTPINRFWNMLAWDVARDIRNRRVGHALVTLAALFSIAAIEEIIRTWHDPDEPEEAKKFALPVTTPERCMGCEPTRQRRGPRPMHRVEPRIEWSHSLDDGVRPGHRHGNDACRSVYQFAPRANKQRCPTGPVAEFAGIDKRWPRRRRTAVSNAVRCEGRGRASARGSPAALASPGHGRRLGRSATPPCQSVSVRGATLVFGTMRRIGRRSSSTDSN